MNIKTGVLAAAAALALTVPAAALMRIKIAGRP